MKLKIVLVFFVLHTCACYGLFNGKFYDAASSGMGEAYVAIPDKAVSIFYNPANLGISRKYKADFTYAKMFRDISDDGLSYQIIDYSMRYKKCGMGMGILQFKSNLYRENTILFGISKKVIDRLRLGINYKVLTLKVEPTGSSINDPVFNGSQLKKRSETFDLGVTYYIDDNLIFGFKMDNLSVDNFGTVEPENLRRKFSGGLSYAINFSKTRGLKSILLAAQFNYRNADYDFSAGSEFSINDKFFIRTGVNSDVISLGLGFYLFNVKLDISRVLYKNIDYAGETDRFTFGMEF